MNADRNWERYQPEQRDSRGGSPDGFQYSDAYLPGGGTEGNRIIKDMHRQSATFDQQGFPDSAQLLPDEQGGGGRHHGHRGTGRGGRDDFDPRGQEGPGWQNGEQSWDNGGTGGPYGAYGQGGHHWEHGGQGGPGGQGEPVGHGGQRWEHGGHGRRGHHGHRGRAQDEAQNQDFDVNGNPLPGTVEASEMGMNTTVPTAQPSTTGDSNTTSAAG